jgi:hypothetical protein
MATITRNYKETQIGKELYFVERYCNNGASVFFWRYGYIINRNGERSAILLKDGLRTRPNLKRMF